MVLHESPLSLAQQRIYHLLIDDSIRPSLCPALPKATTPVLFLTHRQFVKDFHILMQLLPPLPPAANMTVLLSQMLLRVFLGV